MSGKWTGYEQPVPAKGFDGIYGRGDWKAVLTGCAAGWEMDGGMRFPSALFLLFLGPRGTGKRTLARAFAGELGWRFFLLRPEGDSGLRVGVGERECGARAEAEAGEREEELPALSGGEPFFLLVEEADEARERELAGLRAWLAKRADGEGPFVCAATAQRAEGVPSWLREAAVVCRLENPREEERAAYLEGELGGVVRCRGGYDWTQAAAETEGFSFADLRLVAWLVRALLLEKGMRSYASPSAIKGALEEGALRLTPDLFARAAAMARPGCRPEREERRRSAECGQAGMADQAVTPGQISMAGQAGSGRKGEGRGSGYGDVAYDILLDDIFSADSVMNPENL